MNNAKNIEVFIVVEGQTEQTIVRDILAPEYANKGIFLTPTLLGKPGHKGGDVRFDRAVNDIGNFLKQRTDTYISTMFDFFRIDKDWPGLSEVHQEIQKGRTLTASKKAEILETASHEEIVKIFPDHNAGKRFIPYIEMHEFEALLFSEPKILAEQIKVDVSIINEILGKYNNIPEEINADPEKAPSKQIKRLFPEFRKIAFSKSITMAIGLEKIREKCPHFNDWLSKLERLKSN